MLYHYEKTDVVLSQLKSDPVRGLSEKEAAQRLEKHGENRLQEKKKKSVLQRFAD